MSSFLLPTLKPGAKEKLDKLLVGTVESRNFPAISFGATNAKETIYFNQAGEVVFGDSSSGQVDEESSELIQSQLGLTFLSHRDILSDQVHYMRTPQEPGGTRSLTHLSSLRCNSSTKSLCHWTTRRTLRNTYLKLPRFLC
jgi:hypothetical protein